MKFSRFFMLATLGVLITPSFALADVQPSSGNGQYTQPPSVIGTGSATTDNVDQIIDIKSDPINDSCWKYLEATISKNGVSHTFNFCTDRNIHIKEGGGEVFDGYDLVAVVDNSSCKFDSAAERAAQARQRRPSPGAAFGPVTGYASIVCLTKYNHVKFGGCSCQAQLDYRLPDLISMGYCSGAGKLISISGNLLFKRGDGAIIDSQLSSTDVDLTSADTLFTLDRIEKLFARQVEPRAMVKDMCPSGVYSFEYLPCDEAGPVKAIIKSCTAQQKNPKCCCTVVEQGAASKQYNCVEQNLLGNQSCNSALKQDRSIHYETREIPADGCKLIGNESLNYQVASSGFGISTERLRQEAQSLNPAKLTTVADLVKRAITALMMSIGSILFVMYIYAGGLWMFAAGQEEMISKAKNILVWSTLGVAVMLGSYAIVNFVINALTTGV